MHAADGGRDNAGRDKSEYQPRNQHTAAWESVAGLLVMDGEAMCAHSMAERETELKLAMRLFLISHLMASKLKDSL